MKRTISMLTALALLLTMVLTGCGSVTEKDKLKLKNGVLTWKAGSNISYYEVDTGSGGEATKGLTYDLAARGDHSGDFTVTVRGVSKSGERTVIGSMAVSASKLALPIISIDGSGKDAAFVWSPVKGAVTYTYDAHDGNGLRVATAAEDGKYRVPVTNHTNQMIRVVANGTSSGNNLLLSSESVFQYSRIFDMSLLAKYQDFFTCDGTVEQRYKVGTTLNKGIYDLKVSLYIMDQSGHRVTGNGGWGRRIVGNGFQNAWFCEMELDGYPGSGGTIPNPDEVYTTTLNLTVDKFGYVALPFYDFNKGERIVVADIQYAGKSVLTNTGGAVNATPGVQKFDVTKLSNYLAVFTSPGGYYSADTADKYKMQIPTNLRDGAHVVDVTYYVCTASGDQISGDGMWGRRLSAEDVDKKEFAWFNESAVDATHLGVNLPEPTQTTTSRFHVTVKNGYFTLVGIDFNSGEKVIFSKVAEVAVPSGNGIFVSTGLAQDQMIIHTTLASSTRMTNVTLSITYEVSDISGNSLSGDGIWGRRILDGGGAASPHWLCETALDGYPDIGNTLPKAGVSVTQDFLIPVISKIGDVSLQMNDFLNYEMVRVTSVKYNGQEVLKK